MSLAMSWNNSDTRFERSAGGGMRLVISAPRKTGGAQFRCLLSMAYDLKAPPTPAPTAGDAAIVGEWMSDLPENSVSTCDLPVSTLSTAAAGRGVQLIGVFRHPFDLFVSNFDVAQQRAARGREDNETDSAWIVLTGEDLESEATQAYAISDFSREVRALRDSASAEIAVRYEDLLVEPEAVLQSVSPTLGSLTAEQIRHAVSLCPAENVVASRPGKGRRMPALPPGAWRERLPVGLLERLRELYSGDVTALGYDAS